jgi:hypothetical protein
MPDVQREFAVHRLEDVGHDSLPLPAAFFIEARRPLVADGAGEPGFIDTALREPFLSLSSKL